jgi:hypothetical protein
VSGPALTFKVGRLSIRVGAQTLATFDAHRQMRFYQREAGGQLFCAGSRQRWEIVAATGATIEGSPGPFHILTAPKVRTG